MDGSAPRSPAPTAPGGPGAPDGADDPDGAAGGGGAAAAPAEVAAGPETVPPGTDRTPAADGEDRGSQRSQRPTSEAFLRFIAAGWAPRPDGLPPRSPAADVAATRRRRVAQRFPGERLVLPAGSLKQRSNDTDYRFRPHSAFAHLTGLGTDREPHAVLVLEPVAEGEEPGTLYFRPRAGRDTREFFADARYGELWVGVRPSLEEVEAELGLPCRHLDDLDAALRKDVGDRASGGLGLRVVREADAAVTAVVDDARGGRVADDSEEASADAELAEVLSELRLVKDDHEIAQMRAAVDATVRAFADVAAALPRAARSRRGERVVESVVASRAREEGNGVGYDTIAAAGPHACTLHWIRNDGPVPPGALVLVDAGIEVDSLYTADVTRTLPVDGVFTPAQRRVYEAVLEAADAAFAVARPGTRFRDVHAAAMTVIATRLHEWGLLPGSVEESLDPQGQFHRRWMVHGTSHHLGIDVHDCAQARREMYLDAELVPGMVFTIEPGLYFTEHDLLVPAELRGIGVRIEDDVLVTADGCENLSAALPRTVADVEAWMAPLLRPGQ